MIKLYTIGFTGKSAERFFNLLKTSGAKKIVDIRLHTQSQLAGFAKGKDLKYFARQIANLDYMHIIDFAPTDVLLKQYRKKEIFWEEYEEEFLKLMDARDILNKTEIKSLDQCCLLCSEHLPDHCHRRLLAEYFQRQYDGINIIHLL